MNLDPDRLRTKLQDIARSLQRLKKFQDINLATFLADEDSQDIARSRLLIAIEAALNICYHVTAKRLKKVPEDYAQCFHLLGESGCISSDLATRLAMMARFRNRLVHLYWDVDYAQVHEILQNHLSDLEGFSQEISALM